ncbi:Galactomannan galactosyltransferase 1 [Apostasia shenzhenica]|uniref:Galactomannan galactosyltransferase 1 n=1 Tax=Apostasia shenzhenica TaxID=1088818 RepID=A0A2I0ALQ8_9ASPA|nr:Galactomannan galactosyltransferase 1 [Apostasia shenzhenica]
MKIAMVSLSQADGRSPRRRSFRGVMAAVGGNKRKYAAAMGYDFVDASDLVDRRRPPSWSKILAVISQLPTHDWVFWNDADTVVTNPDISLESILRAASGQGDMKTGPDLVVTEDVNGVNAGVFFVRHSNWSRTFLDIWWNQTSFMQFGSTKSGDNDALKYLIKNMSFHELRDHVRVSPMQCLFNSYPWYPSWKSVYQLISSPRAIWKGAYSRGDFLVHLAGLDDKKNWAARIMLDLEAGRRDYVYLDRQKSFI